MGAYPKIISPQAEGHKLVFWECPCPRALPVAIFFLNYCYN
jgi:hypothetical protein